MKVAFLTKARPEVLERIPKDLPHVILAAGPGDRYSPEDLAKVADVDAFLVSAEPVHEQLLAAAPMLKIVQRMGVGYNSLDLEACAKRAIPCCNVAGVNKEAVAEHGMALILALAKNLREADAVTRQADWPAARLLTKRSFELYNKTLGVVGLGDTGSNLARRAKAFDMEIVYNDIRPIDARIVEELGAVFMEKDELFQKADVVSINTDLNEQSQGMVDPRRLALMKPGALLVCCARGHIVDEQALADALNSGRLAGAGFDVFTEEPIVKDNPLRSAKNCLITAHIAGVNPESGARGIVLSLENVRAVVERGQKPKWVVNGVK
ncbi:MAG TPA: NAD(P)-dependent oxidoreductase [bacterium]